MSVLLNADDCLLLLVDMQVGSMASVRTMEPARLKDNAIALATLASIHGLPSICESACNKDPV